MAVGICLKSNRTRGIKKFSKKPNILFPHMRSVLEGQSYFVKPECIGLVTRQAFENFVLEPALSEFQNLFDVESSSYDEDSIFDLLSVSSKKIRSKTMDQINNNYGSCFNRETAMTGMKAIAFKSMQTDAETSSQNSDTPSEDSAFWSGARTISESSSEDNEGQREGLSTLNVGPFWCEICLFWAPDGDKHLKSHPSVSPKTSVVENIDLLTLQNLFKMYMANNCDYSSNQISCFNNIGVEILNNHIESRCVEKSFRITEIRNLILFENKDFHSVDDFEKKSLFLSYINAMEELSSFLCASSKQDYEISSLQNKLQGKVSPYEHSILKLLSCVPKKYCNLLRVLCEKWRESVHPSKELEVQASNMMALNRWIIKSTVESNFVKRLLVSFGAFMRSFHGGRLSSICIEAIVLLINNMLDTLVPAGQEVFKQEHLDNLGSVFLIGGWLDRMLLSPMFKGKLNLPMESINKFLVFLEIFVWCQRLDLNVEALYKKIYGYCFPDFHFDIFDFDRI